MDWIGYTHNVHILKVIVLYFLQMLCFDGLLKAQSGDNGTIVFDQFFQNYYMYNPASHDSADVVRVSLGNRTMTGLFDGVNRIYADASFRIQHHSPLRFSRIGFFVHSGHDGDFISRNRVYGRYSWTTGVGARSSVSAGLSIGVVNYAFLGSQAGAGGASSALDGNAGIWYIRRKLKIGFSWQQLLRPVLEPLNQKFILTPYYNLNAIYTTDISAYISLSTHLYIRYQANESIRWNVAPVFLIHSIFETGVNYQHQNGVALLFGIKSIQFGPNTFRFMGSFLLSTKKLSRTSDNVFELSVGYSL